MLTLCSKVGFAWKLFQKDTIQRLDFCINSRLIA